MKYTNISTKIQFIIMILCFVMMACLMPAYNCYAKTETVLIELKCSNNWKCNEKANWHYYPGDKKVKYSLITIGMKTAETGDKLITNWYEEQHEYAEVAAACRPTMFLMKNMAPIATIPSILSCQRGESLEVGLCYPKDKNPDAYKYYGMLTIDTEEDEEKQEPKSIVVKQDYDQLKDFSGNRVLSYSSNYNSNDEDTPLLEKHSGGTENNYEMRVIDTVCSSMKAKCIGSNFMKLFELSSSILQN